MTADLAGVKRVARSNGWALSLVKKGFLVQGVDRVGAVRRHLARLAEKKVNVVAADAVTAGMGRYGMIVWVRPKDYARAARAGSRSALSLRAKVLAGERLSYILKVLNKVPGRRPKGWPTGTDSVPGGTSVMLAMRRSPAWLVAAGSLTLVSAPAARAGSGDRLPLKTGWTLQSSAKVS